MSFVDDDRHYAAFLARSRIFVVHVAVVLDQVGEQLAHAPRVLAGARARQPRLERMRLLERLDRLDLEPGRLEERAPLVLGVRADVRRVAQPLGLLDALADVERVLDDHELAGDARQLRDGRARCPRSGAARSA